MAKILLLGLDHSVAEDLERVVCQLGHSAQIVPRFQGVLDRPDADIIFVGSNELRHALAAFPARPVIVASRLPEVQAWLNALEAGAADYCGAPFEPVQVRWLLNSALAA